MATNLKKGDKIILLGHKGFVNSVISGVTEVTANTIKSGTHSFKHNGKISSKNSVYKSFVEASEENLLNAQYCKEALKYLDLSSRYELSESAILAIGKIILEDKQ
jgi:hypothetical protein